MGEVHLRRGRSPQTEGRPQVPEWVCGSQPGLGAPVSARSHRQRARWTIPTWPPFTRSVSGKGSPFLALAYCPGETLKQRIERGPLSIAEIVKHPAADRRRPGVRARGWHRPSRLEAGQHHGGPGRPCADIWISGSPKALGDDSETATRADTGAEQPVGTIAYMAPEQVRGETADAIVPTSGRLA